MPPLGDPAAIAEAQRFDKIVQLGWRAFDELFRKTPFDKTVDKLSFRNAPLNVEQWVTDSPPDKLRTKEVRGQGQVRAVSPCR